MRERSGYEPDVQRCQRPSYDDGTGKCHVPASRRIGGVWTCGNHEADKPRYENSRGETEGEAAW